jgi:hypothetical protein
MPERAQSGESVRTLVVSGDGDLSCEPNNRGFLALWPPNVPCREGEIVPIQRHSRQLSMFAAFHRVLALRLQAAVLF